jgi:uncharacterized protein YndB with AHSA1/START domain
MPDINHNVVIKTTAERIFEAIVTQEGLVSWFSRSTIARPQAGYVNVFTFGNYRLELKITDLVPNKRVGWLCTRAIEAWLHTTISFELEEQGENTLLRFAHADWKAMNDAFASSCYDWAMFLRSLKSYCETGAGSPCLM